MTKLFLRFSVSMSEKWRSQSIRVRAIKAWSSDYYDRSLKYEEHLCEYLDRFPVKVLMVFSCFHETGLVNTTLVHCWMWFLWFMSVSKGYFYVVTFDSSLSRRMTYRKIIYYFVLLSSPFIRTLRRPSGSQSCTKVHYSSSPTPVEK